MRQTRQSHTKKIRIGPKRKIGLVCSGGGTKAGAFHVGVALALQEQGFRFLGGIKPKDTETRAPSPMEISTYVGSSAGSIISTFLAAGYSIENIFHSFLQNKTSEPENLLPKPLSRLSYQKIFRMRKDLAKEQLNQIMGIGKGIKALADPSNWGALLEFKWLKMTGLFSTAGIEEYLREEVLLSNQFQDYLADLFIVATQLNHSRKMVFGKYSYSPPAEDKSCEYFNQAKISAACAASTTLPFIYSPYIIEFPDGRKRQYIDGEIRDTLSTHVAVDAGADLIFASYTHQPYHFNKNIGSLTEIGLPAIIVQSIYLVIEQKINDQIFKRERHREAIEAVDHYCKEQGISKDHRSRIRNILLSELHHRDDVDTIHIHPRPSDARMFVHEHFSLSPKKLTEIVRSGFKAAIEVLRKYEFADRDHAPPVHKTNVKEKKT